MCPRSMVTSEGKSCFVEFGAAEYTEAAANTVYVVMKICPRGQGTKNKSVTAADVSDVDIFA